MDESPSGTKDDWSEATSRAVIPVAALERFWTEHPEVSARGSRRVELALWQWVRIEGRSPGTHALPSRAVELIIDTQRGANLPDQPIVIPAGLVRRQSTGPAPATTRK